MELFGPVCCIHFRRSLRRHPATNQPFTDHRNLRHCHPLSIQIHLFCGLFWHISAHHHPCISLYDTLHVVGRQKSHSTWGYINVVSMFFVIIVISAKENLVLPSNTSQSTFETFIATNFHQVNYALTRMLGDSGGSNWNLQLPIVWKVQTFIAFAYTYHYLNWFSKTSVIQWHKVDKRKMYITLTLWISCFLMFYFNYRIGLAAIYVLSMLHIILEFPLNISSIKSLLQSDEKAVIKPIDSVRAY